MEDGTILPSYTIRLWSRASGRYLQILPIGAIPYARGVFGPTGPLQMVVLDEPEAIVLLRCASHPQFHLGFHRTSVTGMVRICFYMLIYIPYRIIHGLNLFICTCYLQKNWIIYMCIETTYSYQ